VQGGIDRERAGSLRTLLGCFRSHTSAIVAIMSKGYQAWYINILIFQIKQINLNFKNTLDRKFTV
jgi:hypothetical protein